MNINLKDVLWTILLFLICFGLAELAWSKSAEAAANPHRPGQIVLVGGIERVVIPNNVTVWEDGTVWLRDKTFCARDYPCAEGENVAKAAPKWAVKALDHAYSDGDFDPSDFVGMKKWQRYRLNRVLR